MYVCRNTLDKSYAHIIGAIECVHGDNLFLLGTQYFVLPQELYPRLIKTRNGPFSHDYWSNGMVHWYGPLVFNWLAFDGERLPFSKYVL